MNEQRGLNTRPAVSRGVVLGVTIYALVASSVLAQEEAPGKSDKIELKVKGMAPQSRSEAPIWIEMNFKSNVRELLSGPLLLELFADRRKIGQLTTQQVVVNGGEQAYRFTLPGMTIDGLMLDNWLNMRVTLLAEQRRVGLGEHQVFAPSTEQRNTALGIVGTGFSQSAQDMIDSLTFNNYRPERVSPSLVTVPARLEPEDLPSEPLGWTQFDAVLLMDDGFAALGLRQLRALSTWVKAGGAVCVIAGGAIRSDHVDFFNDTVDGGGVENRFARDPARGLTIAADDAVGSVSTWRAGLGRVVVIRSQAGESAMDEASRRRVAAYLWGARADQVEEITRTGKWKRLGEQFRSPAYKAYNYDFQSGGDILYQPLGMESGSSLLSHLMPAQSRVVPFSVVVGILTLFVLVVGPGDYYLLGLIRRRKWTWVLFPTLSVVFTVATVVIANEYRGREDHRPGLVLHDVGDRGRVVKRTRLELVYPASRQTVTTKLRGGLFTPIDPDRLRSGHLLDSSLALTYAGRIPSEFQTTQVINQWVSQLYRQTYFGPPDAGPSVTDPDVSRFRWGAVDVGLISARDGDAIKGALLGESPFSGAIIVMGVDVDPLKHDTPQIVYNTGGLRVGEALTALLGELTARPRVGYFSVVARVAPSGGPMLEDLAMLDTTDPGQRVLLVIESLGEDLIIHRRLYSDSGGP